MFWTPPPFPAHTPFLLIPTEAPRMLAEVFGVFFTVHSGSIQTTLHSLLLKVSDICQEGSAYRQCFSSTQRACSLAVQLPWSKQRPNVRPLGFICTNAQPRTDGSCLVPPGSRVAMLLGVRWTVEDCVLCGPSNRWEACYFLFSSPERTPRTV